MSEAWFDQAGMKDRLVAFFEGEKPKVTTFGNTVNQTFEAFVFAALVARYRKDGWAVKFVHPPGEVRRSSKHLALKFSTNGRPGNYSYAVCTKGDETVQIHHQLRVATRHHRDSALTQAALCLDVAVIKKTELAGYSTRHAVPNDRLITFGEAKHMPAFAELIAGFIGMVHEMTPHHVKARRATPPASGSEHLSPFLYVSGSVNPAARGIIDSMGRRHLPVRVYNCTFDLTQSFKLHDVDFKPEELQAKLKAEAKARRAKKAAAARTAKREQDELSKRVPY